MANTATADDGITYAIAYQGSNTVRAVEQVANVVIEIQDSGSGYSPEEQERLFEVYHLAEADRHFLPDLRLALANAREMVKLQGG